MTRSHNLYLKTLPSLEIKARLLKTFQFTVNVHRCISWFRLLLVGDVLKVSNF